MYPQCMFSNKKKYLNFSSEKTIFHLKIVTFTAVKSRSILHRRVIVMICSRMKKTR